MQAKITKLSIILFVMFLASFGANNNSLQAQNLIAHYDFNNSFTDKLSGSVLDKFGATSDGYLHDNATSSFGSDVNGNFWQWESSLASTRGGGLWIDVNSNISTNYSIGVRFSFSDTQGGYRKIIDYKNQTSDNGFYFYSGGKFNFYPNGTLGLTTTTNNTIVDIIVTRSSSNTFKAYIVNNGIMTKELEVSDASEYAVPTLVNGKPRFRFFHDEIGTSREASQSGKVYSIKIWDGPITEIQAETAMNITDFVWNGSNNTSTTTSQNWNENTTPAANANLTIPKLSGGSPVYPQLSTDMTIGKLVVKAGAQITVNTTKTLTANDSVLLESDDNYTAQILNNGAVIHSNAKLLLRKSFKASSGWYFMSFPFDVPLANIKRAGTQTTASTSSFLTATGPSYSDIYIIEYNGARRDQTGTAVTSNSPNWDPVTSGTLQAGKGYAFLVMNDKAIDFVSATGTTGIFDAANKATTVGTYTANSNAAHNSWNLVGVPYTSSFNLANLDQNTFYYLYSQSGQNYEVKERADSYQLYPFSAFFMQASATSLNFAAAGRALKAPAVTTETTFDEIDLQFSNSTFSDRTRIRMANDAQTGYTINEDAVKMLSPNSAVPQLWSKSDVYDLAINALPVATSEIKLNYRTGNSGSYSIRLQNTENIKSFRQILLVDNVAKKSIDLKATDCYTFTAEQGKNTDRFKIVTAPDINTKLSIATNPEISATIQNKILILNGLQETSDVKIFDLTGIEIQSHEHVVNGQALVVKSNSNLLFISIANKNQKSTLKLLNY